MAEPAKAAVRKPAPKSGWNPRRVMVTPEGVDLGVELASLSSRFGALVLDMVILWVSLIALQLLVFLIFWGQRSSEVMSEFPIVIWLLLSFIARNAWFVFWEMTPRAATPGKRAMKIRVAMRNGGRLTADAVFARNVTRELEMFLPLTAVLSGAFSASESAVGGWASFAMVVWALIFALIPAFNRDRLRPGDLIAGTWVVNAPRERLQPDLAGGERASAYAFTQSQIDAYGVMELQVLEQVLRRMDKTVLRDVAARIRAKIDWVSIEGETDTAFLQAYYAALRERLEKRLLFGHRRADKHDRSGLSQG